jgi:hypothetical protein
LIIIAAWQKGWPEVSLLRDRWPANTKHVFSKLHNAIFCNFFDAKKLGALFTSFFSNLLIRLPGFESTSSKKTKKREFDSRSEREKVKTTAKQRRRKLDHFGAAKFFFPSLSNGLAFYNHPPNVEDECLRFFFVKRPFALSFSVQIKLVPTGLDQLLSMPKRYIFLLQNGLS